jgi:hypothetical protein
MAIDPIFEEYWYTWRHADILSIRVAACLLTNTNPAKYQNNHVLPSDAAAMDTVITQAVKLGKIKPFELMGWYDNGYNSQLEPLDQVGPNCRISSDDTTIEVAELGRWCESKRIEHHWPKPEENKSSIGILMIDKYPAELRAAIEVFEAISGDPTATLKQSPKSAISAWLEKHCPELTNNARERVATVANWQPSGGAPKTPQQ